MTTELHVHDWSPWGPSPLSESLGIERHRRMCFSCQLYQDEPTPDVPSGPVPETAIEAAARADWENGSPPAYRGTWETVGEEVRESYRAVNRVALAAAVPHIERTCRAAAFTEAADEVHREALWQKESQMRGMFANGEMSVDRLAMLEDILRSFADLAVARGGEATE
jgi:hypothetical protein